MVVGTVNSKPELRFSPINIGRCDIPGCNEERPTAGTLLKHQLDPEAHKDLTRKRKRGQPWDCESLDCGESFPTKKELKLHVSDEHPDDIVPGVARKQTKRNHGQRKQTETVNERLFTCGYRGCTMAYTSKTYLNKHKRGKKHGKVDDCSIM